MAIAAGLVGLPNVGKSTLFNALTKSSIPAENYPFCTVDPHVAITAVPDERLKKLADVFSSKKLVPAAIQFVDIAGLVRGASKGEGLGNKFLSHIMGVNVVLHVLRCFDDADITHVDNTVNPLDDFETICTELMLKDLESIEKRADKLVQLYKTAQNKGVSPQHIKAWDDEKAMNILLKKALGDGDLSAVQALVAKAARDHVFLIPLLSGKDYLIIANLSEDDFTGGNYKNNTHYQALVKHFGEEKVIPVSAKIESELAQLSDEEAAEMMESLEITERGLDNVIKKTYAALKFITFFTCGPKEAHAWSIAQGATAPDAAGEIHTDLQRGFICAEVYHCQDLFTHGSEQEVKAAGKVSIQGKDYLVKDGDLLNIRFNV